MTSIAIGLESKLLKESVSSFESGVRPEFDTSKLLFASPIDGDLHQVATAVGAAEIAIEIKSFEGTDFSWILGVGPRRVCADDLADSVDDCFQHPEFATFGSVAGFDIQNVGFGPARSDADPIAVLFEHAID